MPSMNFLPTTVKEMQQRGWDAVDVVLFSGDAYVDHPSFGAAVIGRIIEAEGLRVAIVPQPDWHGDYRDFRKFGVPRLFFGISPGCMDSMVNKYTARKRLRAEDAYSPDGRHDKRPEYPTIVYTQILKRLYPDVPVVLGGIEASLRRLTHYDYWQDRLRPSILCDSGADLLIYGMGERPMTSLVRLLNDHLLFGKNSDNSETSEQSESSEYSESSELSKNSQPHIDTKTFRNLLLRHPQPQTVMLLSKDEVKPKSDDILLHSHEECLRDKRCQAENFRHIEEESNKMHAARLLQSTAGRIAVVEPPYPPMTEAEMDYAFDLPYTRLPHPKYAGKRIPAYEMIKFSVNLHRGCFGGCAFCTISAHQGKFISSRSKESILREVEQITRMPDFKGYISDLGGPSANMYQMHGRDTTKCEQCKRPSCIHPKICPNLNTDHRPLLDIYHAVDSLPGVKKSFIGSGVRYDLILHQEKDEDVNRSHQRYARELIEHHVSGRLKVAPEHTSDAVLNIMRKPSFSLFYQFKDMFDEINRRCNLRQQIIPYFISSHPGCTENDMKQLAEKTRSLGFRLEQVQDFTPTPMTVSTEAWYTGLHPYTLQPVYSAKTQAEKDRQNQYFFWYKTPTKPKRPKE